MLSEPHKNFYALLEIPHNAHHDDIKKSFRKKAKLFHPDKSGTKDTELFNQLSVAYQTLIDPELRHIYDLAHPQKKDETFLELEGDETFKAFEELRKYAKHRDILGLIPELEKIYGPLRFREGVPCTGQTCELIWLGNLLGKTTEKPRLLLCKKHNLLHQCEMGECSSEDTTCTLFAHWLAGEWIRAKFLPTWKHCLSKTSKRDYWFNTVTGESLWEKPTRNSDHTCTSETCQSKYIHLLDDVWICTTSGNHHICRYVQCKWTRVGSDGTASCWATNKAYGFGMLVCDSSDTNAYQSLENNENIDLSSRKRKLTYTNTQGNKVTVHVDVPWGLDIGEEAPTDNIHGEIFAKKLYLENNARKEKRLKTAEKSKRNVDVFESEEYSYSFDDDDDDGSFHQEKEDEDLHIIKQKWKRNRERDYQNLLNGEVNKHHLITEKVYDNVEGGVYKTYTEAIDNPDHELDDLGDYATMLAGRGKGLGGYEGALEDQEEEHALLCDAENSGVIQTIEHIGDDKTKKLE